MNRRLLFGFLYCVVFLISVFTVVARTDILILDTEKFDGNSIEIDDLSYKLIIGDPYDGDTIAFKGPESYKFIDNDDCKLFNRSRVCVSEMDNSSTSGGRYKARFQVYSSFANITATADISDESLYEGEETTYTASITNNGGHKAVNLSFSFPLDENVIITSLDRLYQNDTHIYYENDMNADEVIEFEMIFRVKGTSEVTFSPTISYFDTFGEEKILNVEEVSVNSEEFCQFNYSLSSPNIGVDEVGNITISLINTNLTNVSFENLILTVPKLLDVYERERIAEKNPHRYYYDGTIGYNRSRDLKLFYTGARGGKGDFELTFRCRLTDQEIYADLIRTIPITVSEKALTLDTNFLATEYGEAGSGKLFTLDVFNTYNTQYVTVTHVNITIDNKTSSNPLTNVIAPLSTKNLINTTILLPQVKEEREVPLSVLLRYENQNEDVFHIEKNFTLNIYTISLDVTQTVDKTELFEGEQAQVSLSVQNKNSRNFNSVRAYAITQLISTDTPDITFDVKKFTTIDAYNFTVVAPFVSEETTYTIQSFVEVPHGESTRLYTKEHKIVVKPKPEEEATTNSTTSPLDLLGAELGEEETSNSSFSLSDAPEEEQTNDFFQSSTLSIILLVLGGVLLIVAMLLIKMKSQKKKWQKKQKRYAALKNSFHPKMTEVSEAIEKLRQGFTPSQNKPQQPTQPQQKAPPKPPTKSPKSGSSESQVDDMLSKLESMK